MRETSLKLLSALLGNAGAGAAVSLLDPSGVGIAGLLLGYVLTGVVSGDADETREKRAERKLDSLKRWLRLNLTEQRELKQRVESELELDREGRARMDEVFGLMADLRSGQQDVTELLHAISNYQMAHGRVAVAAAERSNEQLEEVLKQLRALEDGQITKSDLEELEARLLSSLVARRNTDGVASPSMEHDLAVAVERLARDVRRGVVTAQRVFESNDPDALVDYLTAQRDELSDGKSLVVEAIDGELARLDHEIAAVAYTAGRLDEAEAALHRILSTAPEDLEANFRLGHIHRDRGRLDEAEATYRRVQGAADDESWIARTLESLGGINLTRGALDEAEKLYRKALETNERIGRENGVAGCYRCLGQICQVRGDLDGAEALYEDSLRVSERLGNARELANVHHHVGNVKVLRGLLDEAEVEYHKALQLEQETGREEGVAIAYGNLGIVLGSQRRLDEAEKMFRDALAIEERLGRLEGMANQYANLGYLLQARKQFESAEKMLLQALELEERIGRLEGRARVHANMGLLIQARCWEHPSTAPEAAAEAAREQFIVARELYTQLGADDMVETMQQRHDSVRPVYALYQPKPPRVEEREE